jgi:uncharacterized protein (TIGR03083 family)
MTPLGPIDTSPLFKPLLGELLDVLRSLDASDWDRPTVAPAWRVRDVAAHLLDGDLRKIAVYRDGHFLPTDGPIESERDLTRFINTINASGVSYAARLSPRLITDLLEITGGWVAGLVETLPLHDRSIFAVSWAGESISENWMDTGREYTERWHHQMQIRDATGRPRLLEPRWLMPLLDISVRALPRAYASIAAVPGTSVALDVYGETTAAWSLLRSDSGWSIMQGQPETPTTSVRVAADDVWRMFYNALSSDALLSRVELSGEVGLATPLLRARSVIV